MRIKNILTTFLILITMASCAQNKIDLSKVKFNEDIGSFTLGIPEFRKGKLFDRDDMLSYGAENERLTFGNYIPAHVELLSYKGKLAGYAFKIKTFADQEKIMALLKERYKNMVVEKSKWLSNYSYKDHMVRFEFRSISKEQFETGMNAYFSIKRLDFNEAYEQLVKQHSKHQ